MQILGYELAEFFFVVTNKEPPFTRVDLHLHNSAQRSSLPKGKGGSTWRGLQNLLREFTCKDYYRGDQ